MSLYRQRLDRVRREMEEAGLSQLLVTDHLSIYYLTGLYVDEAGQVFRDKISGPRERGTALAEQLANSMKEGHPCLVK